MRRCSRSIASSRERRAVDPSRAARERSRPRSGAGARGRGDPAKHARARAAAAGVRPDVARLLRGGSPYGRAGSIRGRERGRRVSRRRALAEDRAGGAYGRARVHRRPGGARPRCCDGGPAPADRLGVRRAGDDPTRARHRRPQRAVEGRRPSMRIRARGRPPLRAPEAGATRGRRDLVADRRGFRVTAPRHSRPGFEPGYGISQDDEGMLEWDWAVERLAASRNYWIVTTAGDGAPAAAPVWGVWFDDAVWF